MKQANEKPFWAKHYGEMAMALSVSLGISLFSHTPHTIWVSLKVVAAIVLFRLLFGLLGAVVLNKTVRR